MVKMATVWDRTAEFLTDNLAGILPIALFAFFVPLIIQGSLQPLTQDAAPAVTLALQLVGLAFAVVALWGSLTLTAMALDGGKEGAARIGLRRLPLALLIAVLVILAFCLLLAPIWGVLAWSGVDMMAVARTGEIDLSPGAGWFVALYTLALVGVGLWVTARLMPLNAVIVAEKRGLSAVARSWALSRGLALPLIGVLLLYLMVSLVAGLAANTVFGSIFALIAGPAEPLSLSAVLTAIVTAAVETGFTVIAPVFTAKLYLALTAARGLAVPRA